MYFDIQDPELWETAQKWEVTYGPLIHLRVLGTSYILVNTFEDAVDLFEKRGHMYSSRPRNVMFELEGWDWFTSVMPYGDELRRSRQLLHRFLRPAALYNYAELQAQSMHKMLYRLLDRPDKFPEILRQSTGETVISLAYGYQAQEKNDTYIAIAEKGLAAAADAEDFFLVNSFPSLQYLPSWLPGAGFKKIAEDGYNASMAMYHEPYEMAKKRMVNGRCGRSLDSSTLLEAIIGGDPVINDETLIPKVAGIIYGAGADTTVSALHSFLLAMLLYPEVQRRAQAELDEVVGKDSLPSFEDRPNLPYIDAIVKETFRWQPVTPFADENDEFKGYFIPAGATILPNVWAMQRNPKEYPEPDEFIPERWLPVKGKEPPMDVHRMFFGFGRRICPGRHFADNSLFIGAASILAAFNITKALDENGAPITPKAEYTPHFVRHPKPFKYVLTPRSDKVELAIRQMVQFEK